MRKPDFLSLNLKEEFQLNNIVPTLTAALVAGAIAISNTIIYGTLVFSDELSPYVSSGVGVALFSGLVLSLVVGLIGSVPNLVAYPQAAIAPIQALFVAGIVQTMIANGAGMDQIFVTVIVGMAFSSFFVGIVFLTFGRFKLGKLIRFMPYPVIGGFLAGLGWLLVVGGMKVMSISLTTLAGFSQLFDTTLLLRWLPGFIFGAVLFVLVNRIKHFSVLPLSLLAGLILFYALVLILGLSLDSLMQTDWLLGPFPASSLWQPLTPGTLAQADWVAIVDQFETLAIMTITGLIAILINYSGIELETKEDIDFDQDLQASGLATLLTSLGGGPMGYPSTSLSILPQQVGAHSRLVGVFVSVLFALTLFLGSSLLEYLPRMIIGGLLVYFGLGLLYHWVVQTRKSLPKYDYFVLVLILIVIATVDLLMGVVVGMLVTLIVFSINYGRINLVRNSLTGKTYQSNVDRSIYHQDYLRDHGESILILKLQGFIFFGTAFQMLSQVRERANTPDLEHLRFVVMDFRLVNGVDSSAINSFLRLLQLADLHDFKLALANLSPEVELRLSVSGILAKGGDDLHLFPDLDHAVEWCEDLILYQDDLTVFSIPIIKNRLRKYFDAVRDLETFIGYLEKQKIPINTILIQQGEPPAGIYFVDRGLVRVELTSPTGENLRLRAMGDGTIVGELGLYLNRQASANVITELPTTVYYLSLEALSSMEKDHPHVAAVFHKYLARILSERLVNANATIKALLD